MSVALAIDWSKSYKNVLFLISVLIFFSMNTDIYHSPKHFQFIYEIIYFE